MSVCPVDRAACADTWCMQYGCKEASGEPLLVRCRGCRELFNEDAAVSGKCPECSELKEAT
jgi:hypothetical protein